MKNNQLGPLFIIFIIIMTAECLLGLRKQFHYVTDPKSWRDAREYCRTNHTDLATVRSQKENEQLQSILTSVSTGEFYLGLHRDPNDVTAWRWTEGLEYAPVTSSEYTNWFDPLQPLPRNCTCMHLQSSEPNYKKWRSVMCFQKRYFLCENNYGTIQLVRQPLTWEEAEQHCKKNHKSLVTITDLKNMLNSYPRCAWIGLFRDVDAEWKWIGETQSDLRNWVRSHPTNKMCGTIRYDSSSSSYKWHSNWCGRTYPFLCHDETLVLVREKKTWEEALEFCRALGGNHPVSHSYDLASLASDDVHLYDQEKISAAATDQVWTGLRFLAGRWLWVSGEQLQHQDLPVCPATGWRCGSLPTDSSRRWEVRDCMEKRNFLCIKTA